MEKTIKELADELGVTKDKVKYQIKKLPTLPTDFTHIESIIKVLEDNTKLLQEQLKQKDLQLEQKNKQIENLQEENKRVVSALENTTLSLQASQTLQAKSLQLLSSSDEEQSKEVEKKKIFLVNLKNKFN